eukprot:jgi/Psemu1/831/gm1.831_g
MMITKIVKLNNENKVPTAWNAHAPKCAGIFCRAITTCRHNAQTLARKNYKDNGRNKQIPNSFPGTVLITENKTRTPKISIKLDEDYRRKNSPEFQCFFKRILGAVSPKQTDFKRKSLQTTISNIFTLSNEAFVLLSLCNNYELWLNTTKGTRKRKKFTDSKLGMNEGWSDKGQELYAYKDKENRKEKRQKQTYDMMETLDKDDKDYKYYIKNRDNLSNCPSVDYVTQVAICLYLLEDEEEDDDDDAAEERRRRDRRIPRIALHRHSESPPFLYLFNSGNEQALLNCCGVYHTVFRELLGLFEPTFDSYTVDRYTDAVRNRKVNANGVWSGRKREANATCCLGLVLHWFRTRGSVARSVSMAFGLTSTVMYKWLKFSRKVLLFVLQYHPKAMIRPPTEEELEEYISAIGAKYPRLKERHVWGAADGLKVKLQQSSNWLIQSRYYNSWVCDTYVNSVFVFAANGRIRICCYNCPSTWHDSTIADHGVYDKIEELFVKFQAMVCVDSAFRVATGRHQCLLSKWGMRMIQGQFPQLKDRLLFETLGNRKVILNLMMLLYNYQTSTIGHNQILNDFMHKNKGYFSYDDNLPEDATGLFDR